MYTRLARLTLCITILCFLFSFSAVAFAQTAGSCTCFCQTAGDGAQQVGSGMNITSCRTQCDAAGNKMLGCYASASEGPEFNQLCWREDDCKADMVEMQDGTMGESIWGGQESFCLKDQGYCYNPRGAAGTANVKLGVAIGSLTEVSDVRDYIAAIYTFTLGIGGLIAILVIMAAGVTWMLAGANAGQIAKAKAMIANGILGLVLLFCAVMIGRLIDPRLVELGLYRAPKLQQVAYVKNDSCEQLVNRGFQVRATNDDRTCGKKGIVEGTPQTAPGDAIILGVEVGDECTFNSCSGALESCVKSGENYSCMRCSDVYDSALGSPVNNVTPSEGVCTSMLDREAVIALEGTDKKLYCTYYNAALGGLESDGCFELVYPDRNPSVTNLNCTLLREYARSHGSESCRAYDLVWALGIGRQPLGNDSVDNKPGNEASYPLLQKVCSDDPCGLAPQGQTCATYFGQFGISDTRWCTGPLAETSACRVLLLSGRADCVNRGYLDQLEQFGRTGQNPPTIKDSSGNNAEYKDLW